MALVEGESPLLGGDPRARAWQTEGVVFDARLCKTPLMACGDSRSPNYPDKRTISPVEPTTICQGPPANFSDPYLFPTLHRWERQRLATLWHMTNDVLADQDLLARLQAKIELLRDLIGWEYCIIGLLDNALFLRLATVGLPLATIPRRESPCSHTINERSGSVLWSGDMSKDWRFQSSPTVMSGGLRSYAGTPLCWRAADGTEVPLGSLCLASTSPRPELTDLQEKTLVHFARMVITEIADRAQVFRNLQKQRMTDAISSLERGAGAEVSEEGILKTLRQFYPFAQVSVHPCVDGIVRLSSGEDVPVQGITDCMWENTALIDEMLRSQNNRRLETRQTIRAVACMVHTDSKQDYLLVETNRSEAVFDDIDVTFIDRCASLLRETAHRRALEMALRARETFMRDITHQLRTPIHGILCEVELLVEDLSLHLALNTRESGLIHGVDVSQAKIPGSSLLSELTRDAAELSTSQRGVGKPKSSHAGAFLTRRTLRSLENINSSGRELMLTVNNILKLNQWSDAASSLDSQAPPYELKNVEWDVLDELRTTFTDAELASITFHDEQAHAVSCLSAGRALVMDSIVPVIANAVQHANDRSVKVTASRSSNSIIFDVVDHGKGIEKTDWERIFLPFEKVDAYSRGVGLGLTLASKAARALGGSVSLVSSTPSVGSHFRIELAGAGVADTADTARLNPPTEDRYERDASLSALVVDDNAVNLKILQKFCSQRAIPCVGATDGEEAFSYYTARKDDPPNLVLMDLQMPVCDGIRATARIREFEKLHGLPRAVIFTVTAQDNPEDRAKSVTAGADDYFTKPLKMKDLDAAIKRYYSLSR